MLVIPSNNSKPYSLPLFLSVLSGALLVIFVPVRRSRRWTGSTWRLRSALWSLYLWLSHLALLLPPQLYNWWSPNLDSRGGEENKSGRFSFSLYTSTSHSQTVSIVYSWPFKTLQHLIFVSHSRSVHTIATKVSSNAKPKRQDGSAISHWDHRVWLYYRVRPMFCGCNPPRQTHWNMCRFVNWQKK